MKIFLICPVRNQTEEQRKVIAAYVQGLEHGGDSIYWPTRDTDQGDLIGLRICEDNRKEIQNADEVHVWFDEASQGSIFDFGMAFALRKPIVLVNFSVVDSTAGKSFQNVLLALHNDRLLKKAD